MTLLGNDLSPLVLSLRSAGLATLVVAPLGVWAAERLRHWHGPRRTAADLLLLSPLVLPPTVVGLILLQLLSRSGPLGSILHSVGIDIVFSWPATVISAAVVAFPLMYRSALASLDQIDASLPHVARSLGASEWRVLRRITLPLAMPGLVAGVSLSFARALGEFGTTLMLAGNIPGQTQTLPLAIFAAVDAGDLGKAWIWTGLVLLINGLCLGLVQLALSRRRRPLCRGPSAPEPPGPAGPAAPRARPSLRPPGPFALAFELQQRHGDFRLDLALATDCRRLAILGASGAGKSLLLRTLAGLERPRAGRIELNGRVLFDAERGIDLPPERRRIAVMLQHDALFPTSPWRPTWASAWPTWRRPSAPPGWRSSWRRWGCWSWPGTIPPSSRGASSSAPPWPGPWCASPTCCCWTNPSPPRMPTGAGGCSS